MKEKCNCYIEEKEFVNYIPLMTPIYKTIPLCYGTKEREKCSCGGDKTKCDFYPEVREKAKKKLDELIVTYDHCAPDVPTLMVARKDKYDMTILKKIQGSEAFGIYYYLTNGAEFILARDIPKKPTEIGKYEFGCPCCNEDLGLEKDDIYIYDMIPPKYCSNCGQKLDWE